MYKDNIKVKGHRGLWYVIDNGIILGKKYYLLEHQTYGEDALAVAIREDGSLLLEDISDGMEEVWQYLEENPLMA